MSAMLRYALQRSNFAVVASKRLCFSARSAATVKAEHAFPTAALVAYYRAFDAKMPEPLIGANIGGRPDIFAEALAGDLGRRFAEETLQAQNTKMESQALFMAARTQHYDELWMAAMEEGCKQFVLLAAGLDARAWRMPRMDRSVSIFELDVQECFDFKAERIAEMQALADEEPSCTRVTVAADLRDSDWTAKLMAAGFEPTEPSFFLAEGLFMYFPSIGAVEETMCKVSSLMCSGSTLQGCVMINMIQSPVMAATLPVLEKYGVTMGLDFPSKAAVEQLLANSGLVPEPTLDAYSKPLVYSAPTDGDVKPGAGADVKPGAEADGEHGAEARVNEADARESAKKMISIVDGLAAWPQFAKDWVVGQLANDGPLSVAKALADDASNFQGWRDLSAEQKELMVSSAMDLGFAERLASAASALDAGSGDKSPQEISYSWFRGRKA